MDNPYKLYPFILQIPIRIPRGYGQLLYPFMSLCFFFFFWRNDMFTTFLQQILSGRLLLVIIIRAKK